MERREFRRLGGLSHDTRAAILFLLPFLVPYVAFKLWPIVHGFWISLHNWSSIGGSPTFVGAQNYERILQDALFWRAFGNTVLFTGLATPTLIVLGMALALILNRKVPGGGLFRTLFYLPNMLSVSVISLIFVAVLTADSSGLVNNVLAAFGIEPISFLLNQQTAMPSIALAAVWWTVGFNMLILLAGLQNIPSDVIDAARVDGANTFQIFRRIMLPLAQPAIVTVGLLTFLAEWGALLKPLVFTTSDSMRTLQVGLNSFQGELNTQWNLILAMTVLTLLPITLVFAFLQRYITSGIATTGMK